MGKKATVNIKPQCKACKFYGEAEYGDPPYCRHRDLRSSAFSAGTFLVPSSRHLLCKGEKFEAHPLVVLGVKIGRASLRKENSNG